MTALALSNLADAINREHHAARQAARAAVAHALECGRLLLEAKATVGHGGWLPWLKANCSLSQRTAQGYMRLAREFPQLDEAKAQRVADLSLRDALGALATQSNSLRRLPDTRADEVLHEADEDAEQPERLRDALGRATAAERRATNGAGSEQGEESWTRVELLPPPQPMPPFDRKLATMLVATVKLFQETTVEEKLDTFVVLETLNAVYCALQDGRRLDDLTLSAPDQVRILQEIFWNIESGEREEFVDFVTRYALGRRNLSADEASALRKKATP